VNKVLATGYSKCTLMLAAAALLGACRPATNQAPVAFCDSDARAALATMVDAHGGREAWQGLTSIYVEREHLFAGTEHPIRFNIHGELPSHRLYQEWQAPPGALAWDGERAWSRDWALAKTLPPRYVASIGFYLVNMPWLVLEEAPELQSLGCSGTLPGHDDRRYLVIAAAYEPDPVRKPAWYDGPRDHYELYIDPESHRLSGVMQHWTYAGRLDTADLPPTTHEITQLFVPETYVEANGLLWPHEYAAYSPDGALAARGRFFDYDFSRPLDAALLFPGDSGQITPDDSSSYHRSND
jgi:hypothetical protein